MSSGVCVHLLGPVRASTDDGPVALRGKTARTVLARLSLSAGSVVGVDQLADALWDDNPPLQPGVSVRSIVSRLRTELGPDAIITDGDGYRLDTGIVDVDLADVEAVLRDVDHGEADADDLSAALGSWRGDALSDVAWTTFFEPERARIHELRARLGDCYHDAMLRSGRAEATLADLERHAASLPLRESTQLLLMRALGSCGRTAEALRTGADYRRRLIDETGLDPSPEYDNITRMLLDERGEPSPPDSDSGTRRAWVPPDTPFVGRQAELDRLGRLVKDRRLVTITGPGGVGKTRLITEFVDQRGGDVVMVSLASLDRDSSVDIAVAASLGMEVSSSDVLRALSDRLSSSSAILVIDNCEHVLASSRRLVEHLLRTVENLHIVSTSRRRLGLPDEALLAVGPLEVPAVNTTDSAPVRLFVDRIERTAPTVSISDAQLVVVADICRLVDGLPLALELAAARVAMFGLDVLRQRLLDGLAVAGTHVADDDRRQATIESTVDWSLDLLSPHARVLFDELSIFPSWFDLSALEHISEYPDVVGALGEILDSSLVVVDQSRPAYRLLEPIRQAARRRLADDQRDRITHRYLDWVDSIVDAIDDLWIADGRGDVQQLIIDHRADLRSSLHHFIERGDADRHGHVASVLARALVDRADIELIELCRADVGPSVASELARCMLAWHQGDVEASARLADDIGRRIDIDHDLWTYYQWARTPIHLYLGDPDRVAESATATVRDERSYPGMRAEAVAMWALGLLYSGRPAEAAAVIHDHEHFLRTSDVGGFVTYARAEVVAAYDPELAIEYLTASSREATAANATFTQRLTDVSRLVLLIESGQELDAARLALRLVPELTRAGTLPQAWTALRHIADLLGQLDAPDLGVLVLDSADADPGAPAVVGDAIDAEAQLRARLDVGGAGARSAAVPVGEVWERVQPILERAVEGR